MDAESFTILALRVISREATGDDQRALETELAAHPERRDEFHQLQITHDVLRTAAPMLEAQNAQEPALPAYRVNELRTAVRQHFGPAATRTGAKEKTGFPILRWLFAGGGVTVLAVVAILLIFANTTIEVGQYRTDLERGGSLSPAYMAKAHVIPFDQDTSFDHWQKQPLAWYQHAKIWTDNEKDLLHIVSRDKNGRVTETTQPLAPNLGDQYDQISKAVEKASNP
jgi:hypothetical protein